VPVGGAFEDAIMRDLDRRLTELERDTKVTQDADESLET
jgi:hypothetical protein